MANKPKSQNHNVIMAILAGAGGNVLKIGVNLLIVPLIIRFLGAEDYGFYVFLFGFSELLVLLEMGLGRGLVQRLTHYLARKEYTEKDQLLLIGHFMFLMMSMLLVCLSIPLCQILTQLFHLQKAQQLIAPMAFCLVFLDVAVNLYGGYYQIILKSHCLQKLVSINDTVQAIICNIGYVVLLWMGYGILELLFLRLIVSTLNTGLYCYHAKQIEPSCFRLRFKLNLLLFRNLFGISLYAFLQRLNQLLSRQLDTMLIAYFLFITEVGIYGFVNRLFNYLLSFVLQSIDVFFPIFSRHTANHETAQASKIFLRMSTLICFCISLLCMLLISVFPEVIHILGSGRIDSGKASLLSLVVCPAIWSETNAAMSIMYLYASGNHRKITLLNLGTSVLNFLISFVLVQKVGFIGPAIATTGINLLYHQLVTIPLACRSLQISRFKFIQQVYLQNIPALLVGGLTFVACKLFLSPLSTSPLMLFITLSLSVVAAFSAWVFLTATDQERQLLYGLLSKVREKIMFLNARETPFTHNERIFKEL